MFHFRLIDQACADLAAHGRIEDLLLDHGVQLELLTGQLHHLLQLCRAVSGAAQLAEAREVLLEALVVIDEESDRVRRLSDSDHMRGHGRRPPSCQTNPTPYRVAHRAHGLSPYGYAVGLARAQ